MVTLSPIISWAEYMFVIPIRWFRVHRRARREMRQRCKVCGCRDKFDFHVPDFVWANVVPQRYRNRVVCLACFDDFAKRKGVDYSTSLRTLYFAGDKALFEFAVISACQADN